MTPQILSRIFRRLAAGGLSGELAFGEFARNVIVHDLLEFFRDFVGQRFELDRQTVAHLADDAAAMGNIDDFVGEAEFHRNLDRRGDAEHALVSLHQHSAVAPVVNGIGFSVDHGNAIVRRAPGRFAACTFAIVVAGVCEQWFHFPLPERLNVLFKAFLTLP